MKLSDSSIDSSSKMIHHSIRVDFPTKNKNLRKYLELSHTKSKTSILIGQKPAWSHKSCAAVDYTPIGVEPHRPTGGVWPIATVANDSQLHLVASSI